MTAHAKVRAAVPEMMLVHNLGGMERQQASLEYITGHHRREEFVVAHISRLQGGVGHRGEMWWGVHDGPDTGGI